VSTVVADAPAISRWANLLPGRRAALAISVTLNLALGAAFLVGQLGHSPAAAAKGFNANAWYAVFVNSQNQEAFVGHVSDASAGDITMRDIYYLTFEAKDATGHPIASPRPEDIKPVIKKLGQEVYGPKDLVTVNRLNLRYYTQLRDDSQVVKAITAFEHPGPKPSPSG
jgi:hypothetical protein